MGLLAFLIGIRLHAFLSAAKSRLSRGYRQYTPAQIGPFDLMARLPALQWRALSFEIMRQ
jgi:hypothetical protein